MADATDRSFEVATKQMKVSSLPPEIQWQLAWHLDSHCSKANWKFLAEKNGLKFLQIQSIEDRVRYTRHYSCTLMLLKEYLSKMDITVNDLVLSLSDINNEACVYVLKTAFQAGLLSTSSSKNEYDTRKMVSLPVVANQKSELPFRKVFLTYSMDSLKEVITIFKWLKKNNCSAILDILELHSLCEDKMGWYDEKYNEAEYVFILISPQYGHDVRKRGTSKFSNTVLYIHSRMQSEYVKNQSRNKRFLPVLVPGAKSDDVPNWLQNNTIIYKWPQHFKDILYHVHEIHHSSKHHSSQRIPTISISTA